MKSFRNLLLSFAEEDFREFTKRTIPCEREILGVRISTIRKLAKSIPKEKISEYLMTEVAPLEEVLMCGFFITSSPRTGIKRALWGFSILMVRGDQTLLLGFAWLLTGVLTTPNTRLRSRLYLRKIIRC